MSPFSTPVLAGAALVSSPAWWNVLNGEAPTSVALTRFLVSLGICWVAFEVVAMFVGPAPKPATITDDTGAAGPGADGSAAPAADPASARAEQPQPTS